MDYYVGKAYLGIITTSLQAVEAQFCGLLLASHFVFLLFPFSVLDSIHRYNILNAQYGVFFLLYHCITC